MNAPDLETQKQPSGSELLSKHKWKIVGCTLVGIAAVALIFVFQKPLYQSEAKLMVRYVVDHSIIDDFDSMRGVTTNGVYDDSIINGEMEILRSWDLTMEVVQRTAKEAKMTGDEMASAVREIRENLKVTGGKGSNVITISYVSADPAGTFRVLQELLQCYYHKHLRVHRPASDDIRRELEDAEMRLQATEAALKELKEKSGVLSLSHDGEDIAAALARSEEELGRADAELTEQRVVVDTLQGRIVGTTPAPNGSEDAKTRLASEVVRFKTLEARSQELKRLFEHYKTASVELAEVAPKFQALERRRELELANYLKWVSRIERARIDERLSSDPSRLPNISVVQGPSPAVRL